MVFAGFPAKKTKPSVTQNTDEAAQVPETETWALLSAVWHNSRRMIAREAETLHGREQGNLFKTYEKQRRNSLAERSPGMA